MSDMILCRSCQYTGTIDTFPPTMSVYSDIRCPSCGSTNNEHNSNYVKMFEPKDDPEPKRGEV